MGLTAHSCGPQLAKGGEAFWLDNRTVAHVVEGDGNLEIYALNVKFENQGGADVLSTPDLPVLIGTLPTKSATNFRYNIISGHLIFSDNVYADGNLTTVKEQDEAWESRGNTAFVYDKTYVRHWDTWVGQKRSSLFSTRLYLDPDRKWKFSSDFINLLKGTGHVRVLRCSA